MSLHDSRGESAANQLELFSAPGTDALDGVRVIRRDGRESPFDVDVLTKSILRAGWPGESLDPDTVASLSQAVELYLQHSQAEPITVTQLRETVERLLIDMGYTLSARLYAGAFTPALGSDGGAPMFDEPLPVDRVERMLAAAAADAGLDRDAAESAVAEVLRQIAAAGVHRLTPGLLSEWMRSELRARGLSDAAGKLSRVSMPVSALHDAFAESDDGIAIAPSDPEAAALALAGRVSGAYVLGQLMPATVGQAHIRGDIQVRGLGNFWRLDSAVLTLEGVKESGPLVPGVAPALAATPREVIAQAEAQATTLRRFFGGRVEWRAVNFGLAPFVRDEEVSDVAQTLIAAARSGLDASLAWDVPEDYPVDVGGIGGARLPMAESYPSARKLLGAVLSTLALGRDSSAAPIAIELSPYFFGAPEADSFLELIARVAETAIAPITLRYSAAAPTLFEDDAPCRPAEIVAQTVSIAAARAAKLSRDLDSFLVRLDSAVDTAAAAHRVKHAFLSRVLRRKTSPLSLLQRPIGGSPFASLESMVYHVCVAGLDRMALARAGIRWMTPGDEVQVAEAALDRVRYACERWSLTDGRRIEVAALYTARDRRRQTDRGGLNPADALALDSHLHTYYPRPAPFAISGDEFSGRSEIIEFIRHAFLRTSCRALRFV